MKLGRLDNLGVVVTQDFVSGEDNIVRPIQLLWPEGIVEGWNGQYHRLTLTNGHIIRFGSAENPDSLKGLSKVAYWWQDEPALHKKWVNDLLIGRGIDLRAPGLLTTTPKHGPGNVWLKPIFDRGFNPRFSGDNVPFERRYFSHNMTTWDNPHVPEEERELLKEIYTGALYDQECLGKFVTDELLVFDPHILTTEKLGYELKDIQNYDLENFMLIDPAWSETDVKDNCESAILVVGISDKWGIFGRESWAGKVGSYDLETVIMQLASKYNIRRAGCEKIGATVLIDNLRRAQTLEHIFQIIALIRRGGRDNKRTRAMAVPPYIENDMLKFPIDKFGNFINGFDEMVTQMGYFTGQRGEVNDRVDTLSDVFNPDMRLIRGTRKREDKKEEEKKDTLLTPKIYRRMRREGRQRKSSAFALN